MYRYAAKSVLKCLDVVQKSALRLCVGVFRTTSVEAMQVEVGEKPLELRRDKLALAYWVRLKGRGKGHPAVEAVNEVDPGRASTCYSSG